MLLECYSTFQILLCLVSSDVFFFLHLIEEGEGENRECCCTHDVQEFICHRVLVLAMGCRAVSILAMGPAVRKDDE